MNPLVDPGARLVIGHRGCAARAPENTLESLQQGIALGADALEFDVRLSADGVAVLLHDPTLDRTTNGRGPVEQQTFAQLRQLDAGARFTRDGGRTFPYRDGGCRIPTLDEALALAGQTPVLIELKIPGAFPETLRLLRHHGAESRALVDSMHEAALVGFAGSPVARGASAAGVKSLFAKTLFGIPVRSVPFDALCVPPWYSGIPLPLERFARTITRLQRSMHVWTINDPAEARRYWGWGVNGIVTDDPGLVRP